MSRSESRRHERSQSNAQVKLRWQGASGEAHFARGKVLNSSEAGVCVELLEPIPRLCYVTLDAPELNRADWAGGGSVRHCSSKGAKFLVGLELKQSARWA
jgi:hypothetical protein